MGDVPVECALSPLHPRAIAGGDDDVAFCQGIYVS